jgi:hypothetical protein
MTEIATDLEDLIKDLETAAVQFVTEGKTAEAAIMRVFAAQFTAVLAEIKKLL